MKGLTNFVYDAMNMYENMNTFEKMEKKKVSGNEKNWKRNKKIHKQYEKNLVKC